MCENTNIPKAVDFVSDILTKENVAGRERTVAILKLENALESVVGHSDQGKDTFSVSVSKLFSNVRIIVRCKGEKIPAEDIVPDMGLEGLDEETKSLLKSRLMPVLSRNIKTQYRYGANHITISASKKKINKLLLNIVCMVVGILAGILVKSVFPANASAFFANEILGTVITAFFNVLKMIVAPLVFFSIISGISGFGDTSRFGSISIKAILYFICFSVVGLLIGVGVFTLLPVGNPEIMNTVDFTASQTLSAVSAWQSFKDLILSIFPSNLLGAFVNNEILAVIFLAVIFGICIGKMQSDFSDILNNTAAVLNDLMCKLATMIVSVMPVIIFCSMAKMLITVEFSSVMHLMKLLGIFFIGAVLLFGVFAIALALKGIPPLEFFRGFAPALFSAVTLASSSAVIPVSLKCCTENLKIPQMITYFVVPLGATINMSGSCIFLTMVCLFTAKVFGVVPTVSMMIPVLCMILLLSMAAPGVPGSNLIMLASLLPMLGIPPEAAQLSICISAFVGMILVPANCTGDAVVAMLIHKGELKKSAQ